MRLFHQHFSIDLAVSGASDGIGKEFALQLAKKGFNILLIGRNQEKLEQVESEISNNERRKFVLIFVRFRKSFQC